MNPIAPTLFVLVAFAAAQEPVAVAPLADSPFQGVHVAAPTADGTIWVRGERYKLAVADDGVRYQPLFGPKAPRDFPVRFRLGACLVDGTPQVLATVAPWQCHDRTFMREHGTVRECWRVMPDAAQQYFVLAQPTAADVTLRIAVAGELALVDEGPGVRFVAPGLGEVRYSDAVVFDARGTRLELPVVVDGQDLRITVPAAFTASAAWPLTVDPLVTTLSFDATVSDVQDAKVACDPVSGNWIVAAEERVSATDSDILYRRYDASVPPVLLETAYVGIAADFAHNPGVGFVAQTQKFIIAWHNATQGSFQLVAISTTVPTLAVPTSLSQGIGSDLANRPLIGSSLSGDRFLLVLFRKNSTGTDILATQRSSAGIGLGTLFVGPITSPSQGTAVPGGVSTIANSADKWVVVWRECTSATCSSQLVRMQAIGTAQPLVGEPAVTLATGNVEDEPTIGGHGGNLLAAWKSFDVATLSNDIHGVPIGVVGAVFAPLGAVQNLSAQEPNVNNVLTQLRPSVSYDGVRFVYGYLEDDGTDILRACAATVFVSGPTIAWHEGHLVLSALPTLSCRSLDVASGGPGGQVGIHRAAWQQDSAAFTGDAHLAVIDARKSGPTFAVTQTGCGAPTEPTISLTGTPALGRTFTVSLGNIPVFPVMIVGPESINLLPGCNGCMSGVDISAMQLFGTASLVVNVPADPALIQFRLAFQGLSGLQPGGCPAAFVGFDFALSDTLTIQVL